MQGLPTVAGSLALVSAIASCSFRLLLVRATICANQNNPTSQTHATVYARPNAQTFCFTSVKFRPRERLFLSPILARGIAMWQPTPGQFHFGISVTPVTVPWIGDGRDGSAHCVFVCSPVCQTLRLEKGFGRYRTTGRNTGRAAESISLVGRVSRFAMASSPS